MARKALIGGVAAAGAIVLGVGGVALATGDREASVATLDLTPSPQAGVAAASDGGGQAPEASGVDSSSAGSVDTGSSAVETPAESSGGAVDAVPAGITADQAREIAVQAQPGTVDWLELTSDYGTTVWYVEVVAPDRVEWDVYIDSRTGEVLDVERD